MNNIENIVLQNKLDRAIEIMEKKPDCLTPPDLSNILGIKVDKIYEWLNYKECPLTVIKYRASSQGRTKYGRMVYKIPTISFYKWYMQNNAS